MGFFAVLTDKVNSEQTYLPLEEGSVCYLRRYLVVCLEVLMSRRCLLVAYGTLQRRAGLDMLTAERLHIQMPGNLANGSDVKQFDKDHKVAYVSTTRGTRLHDPGFGSVKQLCETHLSVDFVDNSSRWQPIPERYAASSGVALRLKKSRLRRVVNQGQSRSLDVTSYRCNEDTDSGT
nr:hypothetical protein CFP56_25908 [Quercus suber]